MLNLSIVQTIAVWAIPVLLAITLHEAAHAWVANRCGDHTAKMLGRLSFNPFHHIDLVGTIIVPIVVAALSDFHFIFGWAKPVPINWMLLKNPRRDTALVAAAGPLSNFIMALFWAACLKISLMLHPEHSYTILFLVLASQAGLLINLILGLLNLLPIPPLDGSRVVASLLPGHLANIYLKIEPFGFFILLALLFSGLFTLILNPLLAGSLAIIRSLFNI